jgi:ferredoxin-nitrite reductase
LLSEFSNPCPGLFYGTSAEDGILSRIRIPGGILNSQQCRAIANIAEEHGGGYVDVTNRANLQIRKISKAINAEVLKLLQELGLASSNPYIDQIRNIMTSPTAGIDPQELIDTRPFVQAWNKYIETHPNLSGLSAKFSVCFDGSGIVSVGDRSNDIVFAAEMVGDRVYFRLHVSMGEKGTPTKDAGILFSPEQCLTVLAALADVYLEHLDSSSKRKERFREVLNNVGWKNYLQKVELRLPFPLNESRGTREQKRIEMYPSFAHINTHPQRQTDLYYIGVVLPLGRLESSQMGGLADLADKYGSETLRLTPWQNVIISDISQELITDFQQELALLGLDWQLSNIRSALVACSGNQGCRASATDTKGHALELTKYLESRISLDNPVNIHFSGCEKSCAQHSKSDIALLGVPQEKGDVESYHLYVGDGDGECKFGRKIYQNMTFIKLPTVIEKMLQAYTIHRLTPNESFGAFTNRHAIAELQSLFGL